MKQHSTIDKISIPEVASDVANGVLDTMEDAVTHARRLSVTAQYQETGMLPERKTIVVLGSGWGSHAFIKVIDVRKYNCIVVSPINHFCFTPMLPSAASGNVEYRSMTETVRRSNPLVEYVEGSANDIDPVAKTVTVALTPPEKYQRRNEEAFENDQELQTISYDQLVVACGVQVNDKIVPGASKFCYRLKVVEDAVRLRRALSSRFERAARSPKNSSERKRLLTFVVAGGGPTGVELAGEFSDFIKDIGRNFPGINLDDEARVILVHSGSQLLQQFDMPQREEALRALQAQGVEVRLNTRVGEVFEEHLVFQQNEKKEDIPYGIAVWCAGTAPQPFMETLLDRLPQSARAGRLVAVDDWLRVRLNDSSIELGSIMALGDCSRVINDDEVFLPQTAQVASQQGAYAARFLNRAYDATLTPPVLNQNAYSSKPLEKAWLNLLRQASNAPKFNFLNLGILAYVGGGEALAEVKFGDLPLGAYAGSAAYLLWKSVYLTKQVATRNRVLVTFDW
eukprot:CAMPEP_0197288990 /NCGR_PEP_ID=MMETSP0890-20130614/6194_1 /TAXON_ID=44058 ORGANISM="Aureoumbra lagunensis, Strain CCMP1510" /NCGR_SAMPLE_ID=MMETSP0890 /ASSEMBLY_ACC=CAM_ASM_000533 /LENGTH=509 /DNA_ID=CAMNT_0042760103 /DNA_START=132 /DNA_END=1658 /DNA_ORIENTATION=+